jgi:hypothetical protein
MAATANLPSKPFHGGLQQAVRKPNDIGHALLHACAGKCAG